MTSFASRQASLLFAPAALLAGALFIAAPPAEATERNDPWVTARTKVELFKTTNLPSDRMWVDSFDGAVTLSGYVGSHEEARRAERIAMGVEGVIDVVNLLQVRETTSKKSASRSDWRIKRHVRRELSNDEGTRGEDVEVASVSGGKVRLTGEVRSPMEHLRVLRIVAGVPGVTLVKSDILEKNDPILTRRWETHTHSTARRRSSETRRTDAVLFDTRLTSQVRERLLEDSRVAATYVFVDTKDAEVALFGLVTSEDEAKAALADARAAMGVRKVHNLLQVIAAEEEVVLRVSDVELRRGVRQALDERGLAGVSVFVRDGAVTLSGTVPTPADRMRAARSARAVEGVVLVEQVLSVRGR